VLISAGKRVAAVWKPAALGACVGILLRTLAMRCSPESALITPA
jgi:hypothetical protein